METVKLIGAKALDDFAQFALNEATLNDTYELNAQTAAGSQILDTNGTNDTLNLSNITLSLSAPAFGQAGLARFGSTLIIDINKNGVANQADDLSIDNFFLPRDFSINDVTFAEGNSGTTNALFTVKGLAGTGGAGFIETVDNLSGTDILNFLSTVTVNYATVDGTATAGTDYNPTSGQLTFTQNETEKIVSVQVIGDTQVEPNETFFVNLSTANNTDIADLQGVGTILNDDLPSPSINVSFRNAPNSPFGVGSYPRFVALGDFNGDGNQDLAVANEVSDNVSILLGDGKGSFGIATNFNAGDYPTSVAVSDLNADGNQDLAVTNFNGSNISVLLGNGKGSFGTAINFKVRSFANSIAVSDLNADGFPDLAMTNNTFDDISVLLGDGTGSFGTATNFNVGSYPSSVAVSYLNTDNFPDLVVANYFSNNVSVLLGDGKGSFSTATNFNVGRNPNSLAVSDLNGDSFFDLAVANQASDNISVLLGDGTGRFSTATNFNVGSYPSDVAVEDLNADGFPDLLATTSPNGNISVLFGDGTGSFGAANFYVGSGGGSVAFGDFNKDGKPDLATANYYSNNVSVLLNTTIVNAGIGGDSSATLTGSNSMIFGSNGDDILVGGKSGDIITADAGSNLSFL